MDSSVEGSTESRSAPGLSGPGAPASSGGRAPRRLTRGEIVAGARRSAAPVLAVSAVVVALLAQFGITQGSPVSHPAYGFVIAVLLFAAAALALAHPPSGTVTDATPSARQPLALPVRWEIVLLAGVIGVAIFFRFFRFSDFPPGLWYDEAVNGTDALSIIDHDHITVWRTSNFGHSTIYFYLLIVSFKTFGYTVFAFRLVPALAGLAAVVAFYFLARWLLGPVPALVATALLAVSRFAVTFSRVSWEASLQPLLEIMAVYFLVRALESKSKLYFFLAGGSLAAGLYTYLGFRFVPVVLLFILLYIAVSEWRLLWRNVPGLVIYAASFAIVVFPLAQYALGHQDEVLARTRDINVFKEIDRAHSYEPLRHNIRASLEMMNVRGDANGRHNLPNAPILDEVSGALLVLGLAVCAWSVRNWRKASMAGWLALALVPGALTISIENPSAIRAVGAIPPLFLIAGLAVAFLHRTLTPTRVGAAVFAVGAIGLVGGSAALNYHQLFGTQAHSQAVYDAFIPVFTDVGELAAQEASHKDVYVTAEFYGHPAYRVLTRGETTRVYSPATQLAFPQTGRDVFLIMDVRDFGIIPTLKRLYPNLVRHDDVDPYGRTFFGSVTIPAADISASHALAVSVHAGADPSGPLVSNDHAPPTRSWSQNDLLAGPLTSVWDGYLWVPSYPGNTTVTLSSPGRVAVEIDGARTGDGTGKVATQTVPLSFGEHRVRLIAGATEAGTTSAQISIDNIVANADDLLYAESAGAGGFQALFRSDADFSTPPVQVTHVPFAVGVLPAGIRSIEYRGRYTAAVAGAYGFAIEGGSSAQLFVDDELVVDNGGGHSPRRIEGTVNLTPGDHVVSLQYSLASPSPWALFLRPPGGDWQLTDGSEFKAPTAYVQPALVTLELDPSWPVAGRVLQGLDAPGGIALLPDGTVVSGSGNQLALVTPDGPQRTLKIAATDIGDIDTTADGRIVLLDVVARSLFVLDASGTVLQHFDGAFSSVAGVGVGGDSAYVTSPSGGVIYQVPLAGGEIATLPISIAGADVKAIQPSDVAVAPDGTLYINDFERHQLVISPDGATSHKTPGASGTGRQVPHVALYRTLVFITDPLNQRILIDDLNGKQRGVFQFPPTQTGTHTTGIAVSSRGEIYAVDPETARIFKLQINIPAAATDLTQ